MNIVGAAGAGFAFDLIILLAIGVLNMYAVYRIITKAGYSEAWILVPVSVIVLWIIAFSIALHAAVTFSTTTLGAAAAVTWIAGVDVLFNWILFLVFAFSDWPALKGPSEWRSPPIGYQPPPIGYQPPIGWQPPPGGPAPIGGVPAAAAFSPPAQSLHGPHEWAAPAPMPPPVPAGPQAGWYPMEGSAEEQVYWSGRSYTDRRQRSGGRWKNVPLNFFTADPPNPEERVDE